MSKDIDALLASAVAEAVAGATAQLASGTIDAAGTIDTSAAIAVGWATVDTERAAAGLGLRFAPAEPDLAMGASCRIAVLDAAAAPGARAVVLVEPSIDRRLAYALARYGEGPVAVWFSTSAAGDGHGDAATPGPFGPERLVAGPPTDRWFVLLVEPDVAGGPPEPGT